MRTKRLLSMALVLALALTLLPASALAAEATSVKIANTVLAAPGGRPARDVTLSAPAASTPVIPQTGDSAAPLLWAGLAVLAGAGLFASRRRRVNSTGKGR